MMSAFVFLLSRSFINRTRARLRRLKQPKYLVGAFFGLLYLYFYFFQILFSRGRPGDEMLGGAGSIIGIFGPVILFLLVASAWIFPHERAALVYSEAEVAFLFPAPVSRRALIHFKLLKSQIAILFTVLLLTLITGRLFTSSHAWMRVLGWWVILSTLNLHFLGASFARTMLLERGISNWLRRSLVGLFLAALIALTVFWARQTIVPPAIANVADWAAWREYLQALLGTPPLSYLLFPLRMVLNPYLATSTLEFAKAFLPAVGVIALHYVWVVRSNVAFEEASVELSRRVAEKIAAGRAGQSLDASPKKRSRAPFALSPSGFAPVAFLWKNLISAQAAFRGRTILLLLIPLIIMAAMMGRIGKPGGVFIATASMLTMMCYVWSLFIGAQMIRCDFRRDLAAMDVLKLFPLRGWQVVAGELLAPVVILTVVQWLLLLLLGGLATFGGVTAGLPKMPLTWIVAAGCLTPFWNGLVLLIPNAAVLLFPGWFQTRVEAPQGIEVTGQRLLLLFGQMIVMGVTIIPAAAAFALGFVPFQYAGAETIAPLVGSAGAALVLAGEIALGVWLVGKLFDRFDLAAEQGG
ncbi:MAG TPA: putative ABC exporter domain-containing protein [Methylomirabilota bacterium]|nr:putative ABC exporter domain-containing protein [Methylomirabilota bacterium]